MDDEMILLKIEARRKGRGGSGQSPCTLAVGYMGTEVVLRTRDMSGRPPLVALLPVADARDLADALNSAADQATTGAG